MEVIPQSVRWLIPEETCPCDIYLYFRGKYALALPKNQKACISTLEKLSKAKCSHFYLKLEDMPVWNAWKETRHIIAVSQSAESKEAKVSYGNKRAELVSYLQKSINIKDPLQGSDSTKAAFEQALTILQRVVKNPMLDWYFQQFHEPPHLFQHNGRVAISGAAFSLKYKILSNQELEDFIFSSLIHELQGDPEKSINTIVSQQTISSLEKSKRPAPENVIQLIRLQDELCSGKGFPSGLAKKDLPNAIRLFALVNHFDHFKMKSANSRRAKLENAKNTMNARKADYDADLWDFFWSFWEKDVEML